MNYTPDRWVVLRLEEGDTTLYKVFACWYGGYGGSDSWKLNSGIKFVSTDNGQFNIHGYSGSVYLCHIGFYGTSIYGQSVLNRLLEKTLELTDVSATVLTEEQANHLLSNFNKENHIE